MAWNWDYIVIGMALVALLIAFGSGGGFYDALPAGAEQATDGIEYVEAVYQATGDSVVGAITALFMFVGVPFLFVWVLLYATLNVTAGQFFAEKFDKWIAGLLAITIFYSEYFIILAGILNGMGATFALAIAVALIMMRYYAAYTAGKGITRRIEREANQDEKLIEQAEELDQRIYKIRKQIIEGGNANTPNELLELSNEAEQASLTNTQLLNKVRRRLNDLRRTTNFKNASKQTKELAELVADKCDLAQTFHKQQERELKEEKRDVKDEESV